MKRSLLILITVMLLTACSSNAGRNEEEKKIKLPVQNSKAITRVVATGKVEPDGGIVELASPTGGIVTEVLKKEGENVKKDEPVIRLDDDLESIRITELKSHVESQTAQIESDKITLQTALNRFENRNRLLESTRVLVSGGAETKQNLDDLETDVRTQSLAVENATANLAVSKSKLRDIEAQLQYSEAEAAKKTLKAPSDGIILSIKVKKGSAVNTLSTFADFAPAGPEIVRAEIDELFADRLSTGLAVNILKTGGDSVLAEGRVFFISPYMKKKSLFSGKTDEQEDRLIREVKISLDNDNDNDLILNSKVECEIILNGRAQ
jgi:multidrug resistance efflux pump